MKEGDKIELFLGHCEVKNILDRIAEIAGLQGIPELPEYWSAGDRALLLSGCGSGKTLFAYKWHQAMLAQHQVGHLIFLYPTRGTATEGFKDYVGWVPESDASLLTGMALYELKAMRENPPDSTRGNGQSKDYTTDERLFALGFWEKRFFSATVDQFLSFLSHS
ncbi:MAG: hypothetical protein SW833_17395 [Cyanobacteriota bacterium]|nr:hypothetical protein [Cyanobacteriota bacterium]